MKKDSLKLESKKDYIAIVLLSDIILLPTVWRTQDVLGVALIGCVCTAFAYSVYVSAQKKVKTQTAGIIGGAVILGVALITSLEKSK